jgi:hypothetical protein
MLVHHFYEMREATTILGRTSVGALPVISFGYMTPFFIRIIKHSEPGFALPRVNSRVKKKGWLEWSIALA